MLCRVYKKYQYDTIDFLDSNKVKSVINVIINLGGLE